MDFHKNPPPYEELQESPQGSKMDHGYGAATVNSTAPPPDQPLTQQPLPPAMPAPTVVHINNHVAAGAIDNPGWGMICPACNARVKTRVEHHATCNTYMLALCLCLFLCWPCVCAPCCCNWCYKTTQFCPNCNARLGSSPY